MTGSGGSHWLGTHAYREEDWLRARYWADGMSLGEIADAVGVSDDTVRRWMVRHGVERRRGGPVVTRSELVGDVIEVAEALGKIPSREEYRELGAHSPVTVGDRFGSWGHGKVAALREWDGSGAE